jgi:hypothetical protein
MDANDLGEVWAGQDGQEFLRVGRFDRVDVLFSCLHSLVVPSSAGFHLIAKN